MTLKNIEAHVAGRHRSVLVVDGSERNRSFLTGLLKQFEYEAHEVGTLEEALKIATVIGPGLIVAARQLDRGNDALEFIKRFRSANPACTTPVIVLNAEDDPDFERECLNAGALTCLREPFTLENFYRVIQVAIEPFRRMTIRISTDLPAMINGKRTDELVRDLSENGAYVVTRILHPLKDRLSIWIKLAESVVTADAEVIYLRRPEEKGKGQAGMGLHFVRISADDQQRIRNFIRGALSGGAMLLRSAK